MAPHEDYSRQLTETYNRGRAIADPQPGLDTNHRPLLRLDIGDIGYIHHVNGTFVRLFNVHLSPGLDGQPELDDLPAGFKAVPEPKVLITEMKTPMFKTRSVSEKSLSTNIDSPVGGASFAFSVSDQSGAILVTPDPIESRDAQGIAFYKQLAKEHIESWHEYAVQKLRLELKLEDLILITGVDRTTSWATAVFSDKRVDAQFGIQVQYASTGVQLAAQLSWRHTQGATVRSGPVQSQSAGGNAMAPTNDSVYEPINKHRDQSLFIRHLRAKRRHFLGLKIYGAAEAKPDELHNEDSPGDKGVLADGPIIVSSPERPKFDDCLTPALDFILLHSNADVAIAHYHDLDRINPSNMSVNSNIVVEDGFGIFPDDHQEPSEPLATDATDTARLTSISLHTSGGVHIEIIKAGDGVRFPRTGERVVIHYVGKTEDGKKFDSSIDRNDPFITQIGVGKVIRAWDEAIPLLSVGTKARLTVPPDVAYGARGFPPLIPQNATLYYEVELLEIK